MILRHTRLFRIAFLAPALILYTVFVIYPVFSSAYYGFTKWNGGQAPIFIGIGNYVEMFSSTQYWHVLGNSLMLVVVSVLVQIPLGLLFAYLLYLTTRGLRVFRGVYFLPVVVAPIAIGVMFFLFYNGNVGPINHFLGNVGLASLQRNWLSDRNVVLYSVIFPQAWQYIGLFVVIFLAAMRSIPRELIESANLDGTSTLRVFFAIVIPLLWEIIILSTILVVVGSLKSFDHSWAISRGGPGDASSYIATLMYKKAFLEAQFGYASAITITIMAYSLAFTILFRKFLLKESIQY